MPKLTPTVTTADTFGDTAFDGIRRRPVLAINDQGELVVCCRSTARKKGWKLETVLFQRQPATGQAGRVKSTVEAPEAAPVATPITGRRASDRDGSVLLPADKVEVLKEELKDILG